MVTVEKIKYKPYRGHLEPIGKVRIAEIVLYPNYLESMASYDFTPYLPEEEDTNYRKYVQLIPKNCLAIELTESWHQRDTSKQPSPIINLYMNAVPVDPIYVEDAAEAHEIYTKIKQWMLR